MLALITGASSGIGKEMAKYLAELGHDLIIVARNKDKLLEMKNELNVKVIVYDYDLSNIENCYKLYDEVKDKGVQIVINNAGYGLFEHYYSDNLNNVNIYWQNYLSIIKILCI